MAKYKKRSDGRYCTHIDIGTDANGKRIRQTVYGRTIAEVDQKISEIKVSVSQRTHVSNRKVTFKEYTDQFLRTAKISKEPRTYEMYEEIIRKYGADLNDIPLLDIERNDLQRIIDENASKQRTCQKIRVVFNVIFKTAQADSLIYKNPCINLQTPKYQSCEKRPLTETEKILLREADFTDQQKAFITLGQYYGLRREEICALKKESFDFKTMTLHVDHACVFLKGRPYERDTKNHESRTLKIFPMHEVMFRNYIDSLEGPEPHIFRKKDGSWITVDSYRSMWDQILKKMDKKADELKLPHPEGFTCHVLRHEFATSLYYAGIPALEAQKLTGHKSLSVLTQIYTHLDDQKRDPRDQLLSYYEKMEEQERNRTQPLS